MSSEIWTIGEGRKTLWENAPERAARMAYLQVLAMWHRQVEEGLYTGIPYLFDDRFRWGDDEEEDETPTMPSRPGRVERDESAGMWLVPGKIRTIYEAAA